VLVAREFMEAMVLRILEVTSASPLTKENVCKRYTEILHLEGVLASARYDGEVI
jgi:hypothetical protein